MLLKKALSIIREEIRRSNNDDYTRGLIFARNAMRKLIIERRGKPAEYGLLEEGQNE